MRRGVVLIAALLVLATLALLASGFVQASRVELRIGQRAWDQAVARETAWSGVHRVMADLAADATTWDGLADPWLGDTAGTYRELAVGDDAWVSCLRHDPDRPDDWSTGSEDENGRVNLNTAAPEVLVALPGMDEALAAAIVDWRDADEDVTPQGAETTDYLGLGTPYRPRNAPFETVEELLLVRGVTPALLWGEDVNRNGVLDPNEDDGAAAPPTDDADGLLDRGLAPFVTAWSLERNVDAAGQARLNLNTADAEAIRTRGQPALSGEDAQAIVTMRQARGGQFATVADLLDVPGMSIEKFRQVVDRFTLTDETEVEGRINLNTAPREVLVALGMDDETADAMCAYRARPDAVLDSIAWPLDLDTFRNEPLYIRFRALSAVATVRSGQVRVQALGWTRAGTFARLEAVCDRRSGTPQLVWTRDATRSGLAMPLPAPDDTSLGGGR